MQIFNFEVLEVGNQTPTIVTVLPDTIDVYPNTTYNVIVDAIDPDGDILTMTADPIVLGATFGTAGNITGTYAITPDLADVGNIYTVTFAVSDPSGAGDTAITNIRVQPPFMRGDLVGNAHYSMNDVVYLIAFLFRQGEAPQPIESGDVDMSGSVNVADVAYLINYLYRQGPRPPQ